MEDEGNLTVQNPSGRQPLSTDMKYIFYFSWQLYLLLKIYLRCAVNLQLDCPSMPNKVSGSQVPNLTLTVKNNKKLNSFLNISVVKAVEKFVIIL